MIRNGYTKVYVHVTGLCELFDLIQSHIQQANQTYLLSPEHQSCHIVLHIRNLYTHLSKKNHCHCYRHFVEYYEVFYILSFLLQCLSYNLSDKSQIKKIDPEENYSTGPDHTSSMYRDSPVYNFIHFSQLSGRITRSLNTYIFIIAFL